MPVKVEITISDILDYVGERVRPIKEGEEVFKAGHIILCGTDGSNEKVIKSLCMRSSTILQSPHEVTIKLNDTWICQCSCKAGLGGYCKHIIATLIYVNRYEMLEPVSCTDLAQKWGKEKKEIEGISRPKPFQSFCHPDIQKKVKYTTVELNEKNFNFLAYGVGDSALAIFLGRSLQGRDQMGAPENESRNKERNLDHMQDILCHIEQGEFLQKLHKEIDLEHFKLKPCCKTILETLRSSNILETATKHEQGSVSWMNERKMRITGSTCYAIFTYGEIRNVSDADWEAKSLKHFFPKGFSNKFTEYGLEMEKEAFELFNSKNSNLVIRPSFIISNFFPWLGFSPDGVILDGMIPVKLLEIKCPYIGKSHGPEVFPESCDFLEIKNSKVELKMRHPYYGQVQLGMLLLNLPTTVLVVYSSFKKSYLEVQVNFNATFSEQLLKTITQKYFNKMIHVYCLNK